VTAPGKSGASPALKFVMLVEVMSFFADFTYEVPPLGLAGLSG
jgi:hypothetical protein